MAERKRPAAPPLNFEKSLKQLEAIVKRLEEEEVPLDQALKLFAEGQVLSRACESQLRAAENQIRKLMETPAGEIAEVVMNELAGEQSGEDEEAETEADSAAEEPTTAEPPADSSSAILNETPKINPRPKDPCPGDDLPF